MPIIHLAILSGSGVIIDALIECKVNLKACFDPLMFEKDQHYLQFGSLLHNAIQFTNEQCVCTRVIPILINAGLDVNAKNKNGFTPLMVALDQHQLQSYGKETIKFRFDIIKLLIESGASIDDDILISLERAILTADNTVEAKIFSMYLKIMGF
jgi:Ankyrin repeat.